MRFSVFRTAAIAASFMPGVFAAAAAPTVGVDGLQGIADSLNASAQSLSAQAGAIASANAAFNASAGASASPTLNLTGAISGAVSTFWSTAFDVEKKVCTIVFTINPATIAQAQAALIAGVQAQVTVVSNLVGILQATAATLKAQISVFTEAELAIIKQAVAALVAAANASVEPLTALATGGAALGLGATTKSVADLQNSVYGLVTVSGVFAAIIIPQ